MLHRCCLLVACCLMGVGVRADSADKPGKAGVFPDEKITVSGKEREFRLIVPKSADLKKPIPCVIAFHGMLIDSKDFMPRYTRLDKLAEEKGFLLVFPEAINRAWGLTPEKITADLAFFDALLDHLDTQYNIDPKRIDLIGMSNGSYFAQLVAKERSTKIAAVCAHSGPLGLQTLRGIHAERKFPVMIVFGDQDQIFPIEIARENRDKYEQEKHPVKYVEVPGLKHQWAHSVKINDQIWKFFEEHPLE